MSQKKASSPRLATIKMVEQALIDMPGSVMTVPELKRALPRQVNHNTLKEILEYLQESNKIVMSVKGITWIVNDSPKMKKLIENSWEWTPDGFRKYRPSTNKRA